MRVWPGLPYPLGAIWDGSGVLNASDDRVPFNHPAAAAGLPRLELVLSTASPDQASRPIDPMQPFPLEPRSLALFRWPFKAIT